MSGSVNRGPIGIPAGRRYSMPGGLSMNRSLSGGVIGGSTGGLAERTGLLIGLRREMGLLLCTGHISLYEGLGGFMRGRFLSGEGDLCTLLIGLRDGRMGLRVLIGLRVRRIGLLEERIGLLEERIGLREGRIGLRELLMGLWDRPFAEVLCRMGDRDPELVIDREGSATGLRSIVSDDAA